MSTEWVLLPVPKEDYTELKQIVEHRQQQRGEVSHPSLKELRRDELVIDTIERAAFGKHKVWPVSALERLAKESTVITQRFARAMDLCAKTPSKVFSTEEMSARLGISVNEWRAACRKIGVHLEIHYPEVPLVEHGRWAGKPMWPLMAISGRDLKKRDQLYVGISAEQAERWMSVRQAPDSD